MKKAGFLVGLLLVAGAVFGQNNDIFSMIEGLTNNFPAAEDGARKTMISNGFIPAGGGYINSFEGTSIESTLQFNNSINETKITFILNFDNDAYFVRFVREFLSYFSNKREVSFNGSGNTVNYYVFYNKDDPTTLSMVYDINKYKNNVFLFISLNN